MRRLLLISLVLAGCSAPVPEPEPPLPGDPWGTPYRYVMDEHGRGIAELRSAGPDRVFDTADDVTYQAQSSQMPTRPLGR